MVKRDKEKLIQEIETYFENKLPKQKPTSKVKERKPENMKKREDQKSHRLGLFILFIILPLVVGIITIYFLGLCIELGGIFAAFTLLLVFIYYKAFFGSY